jgi:hypothetical protein
MILDLATLEVAPAEVVSVVSALAYAVGYPKDPGRARRQPPDGVGTNGVCRQCRRKCRGSPLIDLRGSMWATCGNRVASMSRHRAEHMATCRVLVALP